jgi:hypothetical protein
MQTVVFKHTFVLLLSAMTSTLQPVMLLLLLLIHIVCHMMSRFLLH